MTAKKSVVPFRKDKTGKVRVAGAKKPNELSWSIKLNNEFSQQRFIDWVSLKTMTSAIDPELSKIKNSIVDICLEQYCDKLFKHQSKITNPTVEIHKNTEGLSDPENLDFYAQFVVSDKYTFSIPSPNFDSCETDEDCRKLMSDHAIKYLQDHDCGSKKDMTCLVLSEIEIVKREFIRPVYELLVGRQTDGNLVRSSEMEKRAGVKLIDFIQGRDSEPLTDAERMAAVVTEYEYQIKPGFVWRAYEYAKSGADIFYLFKHIKPTCYLAYQKFAANDNTITKNKRLKQFFDRIVNI
jgi:hypothetical protein